MCLIGLCFFVFSFSASSLARVDLSGCSFLCIFVCMLFVSGMFALVCVCVCVCMYVSIFQHRVCSVVALG